MINFYNHGMKNDSSSKGISYKLFVGINFQLQNYLTSNLDPTDINILSKFRSSNQTSY